MSYVSGWGVNVRRAALASSVTLTSHDKVNEHKWLDFMSYLVKVASVAAEQTMLSLYREAVFTSVSLLSS